MGIFDGVLLASDYDGTLRGDRLNVLERDKAAIRRFQQAGGTFLMVTGRCYSDFRTQARELPLTHPTLLSNGATYCRMDTGEVLFSWNLPDRAREDAGGLVKNYPQVAMQVYSGITPHCCQPNAYAQWHKNLVGSDFIPATPEEIPLPWLKALFLGEPKQLEEIKQQVLSRWSDVYECFFSAECLLELTAKNVHKGAGVLEAAKRLGIDREHIYCVGDNANDLPMLHMAKIGFTPAGSLVDGMHLPDIETVRNPDQGCVESVVERLEEIYGA